MSLLPLIKRRSSLPGEIVRARCSECGLETAVESDYVLLSPFVLLQAKDLCPQRVEIVQLWVRLVR